MLVARNWRGGGGEIDRIAWDGDCLCFVEVRFRTHSAFGGPEETVHGPKRRRLVRAATAYLARYRPGQVPNARFDVVALMSLPHEAKPRIEVFKDAFDAEGRPR